jgi:hypothetical protein
MDAEAERPVVHVFRGSKTTAHQGRAVVDNQCRGAGKVDRSGSEVGALYFGVHHVETHVEVLGDVPLCARTDPPSLPVSIAANVSRGYDCERGAGAQ